MTQTNTSPKDWLEGRRLRAWELKQAGWKQCDLASALGVSQGAVSQWMQRAGDGNIDALRSVSPPGAPSRLKFWQQLALMEMLVIGAEAFGWIQLSSARFMNQGLFRQTPLEGFETPGPFSVVH